MTRLPQFPISVCVFLSQEQADNLQKIKEGRGWSRSEVIRRSLALTFKKSVYTDAKTRAKQDKINIKNLPAGDHRSKTRNLAGTNDEGGTTFAKTKTLFVDL